MNSEIEFRLSLQFSQRLTELVTESGYKKSDLPSLIGISKDIFIRALNIGIIPSTKSLIKIANFFEVSIEYLIGLSDSEYFSMLKSPISFSQRLCKLKSEKRVTSYEIALNLGFSRSLFNSWEKKDYLPSLEIIYSLSRYFDVSIDYLLGRTDDRN